jgi:hypothetical protein
MSSHVVLQLEHFDVSKQDAREIDGLTTFPETEFSA